MNRITKDNYENIIYISHPYGGKPENMDKISEIITKLQKTYPTYLFISPVHAFGYLYSEVDYQKGLNMTLFLLDQLADEMWIFGNYKNSKGCMAEIEYCKEHKISTKYTNICF